MFALIKDGVVVRVYMSEQEAPKNSDLSDGYTVAAVNEARFMAAFLRGGPIKVEDVTL